VETGPDRAVDGVVRWRRADLQRVIEERFGVAYHERTIGKLLKALGFSHISARPRHPKQDDKVMQAFKKTSRARSLLTSQALRARRRSRSGSSAAGTSPGPRLMTARSSALCSIAGQT